MTKQHTPNRFLERVKLKLHDVTVPLICKIAIPLRDACLFGAHTYIYSNMTKYMVVEDYFMVYKIRHTFALKCPGLKEILRFFEMED